METVAQLNAALTGRYEIEREIGMGGMATVYLARDVRHDRAVALKVLKPELGEAVGPERFLAEIRVTANLQHPNLLPLFDSGETAPSGYHPGGRLLFYVMPYVDGESLRARLDRERQLPVDEAVHIAVAVANALEYAHQRGVIHRDLKPENILLQAGEPVVADFGIALAVSKAGGARITQTGISLGTPQYMSPEQATGESAVDGRTDIYSLGAVLYEMLTGEPPHGGKTAQMIIARVLTERPRSVRAARASVPPHVEAAVERALQKLPADRFATARALAEALQSRVLVTRSRTRSSVLDTVRAPLRSPLATLAVVSVFVLGAAVGWMIRPLPPRVDRLEVFLPREQQITDLGVGYPTPQGLPDGSGFVYSGTDMLGIHHIFRRTFGSASAKPIPGWSGEVARGWPFPSPDGKHVALLTVPGLRTYVTALTGGEPALVTDSLFGILAWGRGDGMIHGIHSVLAVAARVPVTGGRVEPLSAPDATGETGHWMPEPLPHRRGVLVTVRSGPQRKIDAYVAVIDPVGRVKKLTQGFGARYAASGNIVFARTDGALYAAPFDLAKLQLRREPVPVVRDVTIGSGFFAYFSLSADGSLLYIPASQTNHRNALAWVDRSGRESIAPVEELYLGHPRISPGGDEVAFETGWDVVVHDFRSATTTQLSRASEGGASEKWYARPAWRSDRVVTVGGLRNAGEWRLYDLRLDEPGAKEAVLPGVDGVVESMWRSSGGLVFVSESRGRGSIFYTDPSGRPIRFAGTAADQHSIDLSPDGHWLAYVADGDVRVARFPDGGARVQVSSGGGTEPRWARSGKELFYRSRDSLMVAAIRTTPALELGVRGTLFSVRGYKSDPRVSNYDVSRKDQRFLFVKILGEERPQYIVVERHWADKLADLLR